jgi:hypothetical protein
MVQQSAVHASSVGCASGQSTCGAASSATSPILWRPDLPFHFQKRFWFHLASVSARWPAVLHYRLHEESLVAALAELTTLLQYAH